MERGRVVKGEKRWGKKCDTGVLFFLLLRCLNFVLFRSESGTGERFFMCGSLEF